MEALRPLPERSGEHLCSSPAKNDTRPWPPQDADAFCRLRSPG